jgi:hypothetical protein
MEQKRSYGADSRAAGQENLNCLWSPNLHYRVHMGPPLAFILNQTMFTKYH